MMLGFFVGLTSCESSDPSLEAEDGLVSETVPTQKGWSGSTENGICTYAPEVGDDASGYYAFSFKDGVCSDAVYNMLFDSEVEAKIFVETVNKGNLGIDEDEEDVPDYSEIAKSPAFELSVRQLALMKKIILENYIEGLHILEKLYDDKEYLTFVDDLSNNEYIKAFIKTSSLATLRGVDESKILRTKTDIDNYFIKVK